MFEFLGAHVAVKDYLSKAVSENKLPHALLLTGKDQKKKEDLVHVLAAHLLKTNVERIQRGAHPDFYSVRPEGKAGMHAIDSLRILIDEVHNTPFEGVGKVFVLHEADRMQPACSNALLKTLEEPNLDTTLILLTERPSEILPTIRSRTAILSLEIEKPLALPDEAEILLFSLFSHPSIYPKIILEIEKLSSLIEDEDPLKRHQNREALFSAILMWVRDQEARRCKEGAFSLFFPQEKEAGFPLPTIEKMVKEIDEVRDHLLRNISLTTCLDRVIARVVTS